MAGLGVKVYLDENVDLHVMDALKQRGYDVLHALAEGNVRLPDEQHLRFATARGYAVVTHALLIMPAFIPNSSNAASATRGSSSFR